MSAASRTINATNLAAEVDTLPPMLSQYLEYKKQYPDCVILFQVGDFYEVFFDDAIRVAHKLNLTLTSRDKNNPNPIPMCGVPVASVDTYVERLISSGFSAAIVSQTNSATDSKTPIERKLTRMVTPGVRILAQNDTAGGAIVAALFADSEHEVSVSYSQVQNAAVSSVEGLSMHAAIDYVRRLSPAEILLPSEMHRKPVDRRLSWVRRLELVAPLKTRTLDETRSTRQYHTISGFPALSSAAKRSVRLLLDYVDDVTVGLQCKISRIVSGAQSRVLSIDAATRDNLELVQNCRDGSATGTLLSVLNHTVTPSGERLLRQWILQPLTDLPAIQERQSAVKALRDQIATRAQIKNLLSGLSDIERIAARVELGVASPRELSALREGLRRAPDIRKQVAALSEPVLQAIARGLENSGPLAELLERALVDVPPIVLGDGETIRSGYHAELDAVRDIRRNAEQWMAQYELIERERSGISSLKVRSNNVLGFFLEVTRANIAKVPSAYERRQSTANAERFTTPELREREAQMQGAGDKERAFERELFEELRKRALEFIDLIRSAAAALSQLDVLQSLAEAADAEDLVFPEVNDSRELWISAGRHPVLARLLEGRFIPNSLDLSPGRHNCLVITGPNMGGKSTFLRQAGLVVILAQMGSAVPVKEARVGIVDRMYARIGASDNIAEGESTFMVEMREASQILLGATDRSLLLIDEIGRGTATADGLAIAQSILEWLVHKLSCRTLFATHFHELTLLEGTHPAIANFSVGSIERGEEVIFTHEICRGPANKSYGIEVAKLAGLPKPVLDRAKQVLKAALAEKQEQEKATGMFVPSGAQLALFSAPATPEPPSDYEGLCRLRERLSSIDINDLTPLAALNFLAELKHE